MTNYARIINDVAVDVSTDPAEQFHPSIASEFESVPDKVQAGWTRSGTKWSKPADVVVTPPAPAENSSKIITRAAFRKRFTEQEKIAIEMAAIDNPIATSKARLMSATLRTYQKDWDAADFIDLADADAQAKVNYVAQMQVITQERATEILTAAIVDAERP